MTHLDSNFKSQLQSQVSEYSDVENFWTLGWFLVFFVVVVFPSRVLTTCRSCCVITTSFVISVFDFFLMYVISWYSFYRMWKTILQLLSSFLILGLFYILFFFFFKWKLLSFFLSFFMAVLGLRFCARAFSSCGKRGPLFTAVRGPLTVSASLVVEHKLQTRRLSSCGSRAQLLRGMWDPPRPGLEPVSPALAGRFSTTAPPGKPLLHSYKLLRTPETFCSYGLHL